MSSAPLTPVSYLVLGLIARAGRATPYDLKRFVSSSIGFFWPFPHSQLYAEPARLADNGLLREQLESGGRRRRTYSITREGRRVLAQWVRDAVDEPPQLRDLAMLKLFFGEFAESEDVLSLARAQEATHRARLAVLEEIDRHLRDHEDVDFPHATVRLGLLCTRAYISFWSELARNPPRSA